MEVVEYVQMALLVAVASFCQNLTGFAFSLIFVGAAGALQLMPIADAANVAGLLSLVNGVAYLRSHPFDPRWDLLRPMLLSSVPGVGLGLGMLYWLSGNALSGLRMVLGVAIIACAVLLLAQKRQRTTPSGAGALWGAGLLSGLLGGLFSTAGPPMVYHLYRQPLPALLVRQCLLLMFLACTLVRLAVVVATGTLPWHVVWASAVAAPVVAGVTWLQARRPPRLPVRVVQWIVCGLLMLAGASLLASGL